MSAELERHAAACIFAGFPGTEAPGWIREWLGRGLGGVVLFADNVAAVGALTESLRAEREDVVVAIDEEGGDVTRLEATEGSSFPGNLALGVVDDTELTEAVGAAIAAELARVGVSLNLAPVADVNSNPDNPIVGVRSFGSDPALVARHVGAFVRGTQRLGVAACAKHFPGHGDTAVDSHLALPVVEGDLDGALLPFRAAVEAGVRCVMTGHLVVPGFGVAPATLNPRIVTGLLRDELGFDGLVVSDALEMRAISGTVGIEEGAIQALEAGVDVLCLGRVQGEAVVASVQRAILEGVPADRIAEAAARVASASRPALGAEEPDRELGLAAARRALRVEGDVVVDSPPLVVELEPEPSIAAGPAGHGLGEALRRQLPDTDVIVVGEDAQLPAPPEARPLVLVLRDAARHPWQQRAAAAMVDRAAVVVETGVPGWLPDGASSWIATHGAGRVNLEAAADAIYGSDTKTKPMHISSEESSPQ